MATDAKTSRKSSGTSRSPSGSAKAAKTAVEAHGTSLTVPSLGAVQLPSKGTLAYFAAVAGLAALGLLEWPVVIGVGHLLAQQRGNVLLEEFGDGLSDA